MALEISPQVVVTHFTMANIFVSKVNIVHLFRLKKKRSAVCLHFYLSKITERIGYGCVFLFDYPGITINI